MKYLFCAEQMKAIDACTIDEIGIPAMVLMERAALMVADAMDRLQAGAGKILALCGMGNNGGDGIAAARILAERGYEVRICLVGNLEKASESMKKQLDIAKKLHMEIVCADSADVDMNRIFSSEYTGIIDALFGIGLSRNVEGIFGAVIEKAAHAQAKVVAVDMPSGIHTDTGQICGIALKADVTVTFGYAKPGLFLYPGRSYAGKLIAADIGFAEDVWRRQEHSPAGRQWIYYDREDLSRMPYRPAHSNKGSFGRVLVVAGSKGMSGAALLSAKAAYRVGAGLVQVLTEEGNRLVLQTALPEAIVSTYGENTDFSAFFDYYKQADAVVIGPGLGKSPKSRKLLRMMLKWQEEATLENKTAEAPGGMEGKQSADSVGVPLVLDADALNMISESPEYYQEGSREAASVFKLPKNCILTPHVKELSRLLKTEVPVLASNLPFYAQNAIAGQEGLVMVAKDSTTLVVDEDYVYMNQSGCEAMATGGSGDVLSGMIGGLLAQGLPPGEAARMAVYLHGLAGERAAKKRAGYSVMAGDILEAIGIEI